MSEYLASELPLITGEIPLGYDLDEGYIWRLPGSTPWSRKYVDAPSGLLASLTAAEIVRAPRVGQAATSRAVRQGRSAAAGGGVRQRHTRQPQRFRLRDRRADALCSLPARSDASQRA